MFFLIACYLKVVITGLQTITSLLYVLMKSDLSKSRILFYKKNFQTERPHQKKLKQSVNIPDIIHKYLDNFDIDQNEHTFVNNGLFGFVSHEAIKYFENISLSEGKEDLNIPDIFYGLYQNIIAISLFNHEAHIFCTIQL